MVCCYSKKVFDSADHSILIGKLRRYTMMYVDDSSLTVAANNTANLNNRLIKNLINFVNTLGL